jgi:glycosyltransferase involved in cell wall biosynthesis
MKIEGLSLFFPCHNEAANVEGLLGDALRIAPQIASPYEVIIVDDGSTDATADIALRVGRTAQGVRLVRHPQRQGYGMAIRSGLLAARYPWIFFSDGDRQFDLEELRRFVEKTKDADIVAGYRAKRADAWHRRMNARIFGWALKLAFGLEVPDVNCAFKIFRRELFDRLELESSGAMINAEILTKARRLGYTIATMEVTHRPRTAGRQSGAQVRVVTKAIIEFISLWRKHHQPNDANKKHEAA